MKIALAQHNFIIGDFKENLEVHRKSVQRAVNEGADLVVFSELSICGYPPHDLLERKEFISRCEETVLELAKNIDPDTGVLVGGPELNTSGEGKLLYNAVFFLLGGEIRQIYRKALLPTYDIFDEYRYFEPGNAFELLEFKGEKLAITICEDLWDEQPFDNEFSRSRLYTTNPLEELVALQPDVILNLAASPFAHRKMGAKEAIFTGKAKRYGLPLLYCNQWGAQTDLIFEGGSLFVNKEGRVVHRMAHFGDDFQVFDTGEQEAERSADREEGSENQRLEMIRLALVCGIRDYFGKTGFSTATLGLSGGIDSAVTMALAAEALGADKLHVLLLPSQYSSAHSVDDSVQMCEGLGIRYTILPIESLFNEFRSILEPLFGDLPEDIAEENIQARIRGTLLMALSNKFGNILLNTSNKSETAVGYGTLYGDMSGGLSVLGDVYKTDVYALARHLNRERECVPDNIITKAPSAELRPDQKDSDSLPPYDTLDSILEAYIERQMNVARITALGYEKAVVERVIRLVDQNEYKRYQTPPILRISSKAFGTGRRLPLVARYG